jgi:hypothetical protein
MSILHLKILVVQFRSRNKNFLKLILHENISNSTNMKEPTRLHGVAAHKAMVFTVTTVGTSYSQYARLIFSIILFFIALNVYAV